MIAKGNLHGDGAKLAAYLLTGEDGEIARLIETRGLEGFGGDPVAAFDVLQQVADAQTNSTKPFFHTQTRNAPGERLTDTQWLEVADREEKRLGLTGQPRVLSLHIDPATGEKHMHAAWFRIDLENMRAIDPGMFKNHLKEVARKAERDFALREVSNTRQPHDRARIADRKEAEQSRRLGTDVRAIRTAILDCYEQSDSGKAFRAALDAQGLMLANGERRDCFVVVDAAGGHHALNKKLTGQTLAVTRDRLADLERSQLPSVEQAQALQAERHPAQEAAAEKEKQPEPQAQPEQHTDFTAAAARTTEPAAMIFDRDAAEAEWSEKLAAAAIAKDEAARAVPKAEREARRGVEHEDRPTAHGPYWAFPMLQAGHQAEDTRPLGQTAGEIRLAWNLSRSREELEAALAAHCITLARATAQEAEQSQRISAFAKEIGNFAPAMTEGEIVAVDGRGAVHRLTERTTGDTRAEIEKRSGLIDRDGLMNVADAKDAMRAASLAAWKTERQVEREKARPATALEGRIIECAEHARLYGAHVQKNEQGEILLGAAALAYQFRAEDERTGEAEIVHGHDAFAARLHDAGIAIVRVTASDVPALDALRQGEAMARLAAETNGEARKQHHFAELLPGDLAAVTRGGDVHRISADKLRGVELPAELPSVTEARAAFETDRTDTTTLWELKRAEIAAEREAFAERQKLRSATVTAESAVHNVFSVPAAAIDTALDAASGLFGGAAKIVSGFIGAMSSFFGDSEPKLTRQQVHETLQAQGNVETNHARDVAADTAEQAARLDDLLNQIARSDDIARTERHNRTGGATSRDQPLERDDDYGRERER